MSEIMRERWADPEWRAARTEAARRRYHEDTEFRARFTAGLEENRDKQRASIAALKENPEYRARQREAARRWHGEVEHVCAQCGAEFTGSRLARRCPECRNSSGAWRRRVIAQLIVRDGADCHLCQCEIDFALSGSHQQGPTIDHLIPRGEGGTNRLENLRLAHRSCNQERGLKAVAR